MSASASATGSVTNAVVSSSTGFPQHARVQQVQVPHHLTPMMRGLPEMTTTSNAGYCDDVGEGGGAGGGDGEEVCGVGGPGGGGVQRMLL